MLLNSITIPIYEAALREFERKFPAIPVEYCISTWLENWKEKVVRAWVDQRPHFDNTATSRVEGCHAKIKEYLDSSTRDLKRVYESLELYWTKQHADYKARLEPAKTRTPIRAEKPIFALLLRKIYPYALNKLVEQLNRPEPLPQCTGTFRLSMGLPCAHDI